MVRRRLGWVLALALSTCACAAEPARVAQSGPPATSLEDGWERRWDDRADAPWDKVDLRQPAPLEGHHSAEFRVRLPSGAWQDPAIYFKAISDEFDATLDGRPLASFGTLPFQPGRATPAEPWFLIRLPSDFAGKELLIRASSWGPYDLGPQAPVAIGARSELVELMLEHAALPMGVGLLCFFTGLCALGFAAYRPQERNHLAFALWAIAVGATLISNNDARQLIWDAPVFWRYVLIGSRLVRPAAFVLFASLALETAPRWVLKLSRGFLIAAVPLFAMVLISFSTYRFLWRYLNLEYWLAQVALLSLAAHGLVRRARLAALLPLAVLFEVGGAFVEVLGGVHWTAPHPSWMVIGHLAALGVVAAMEADLLARVYRELARHASELERKNALLTAAEAQLNQAVAARDEFLSVASHELRTPLSALTLQLEVATRAPEGASRALGAVRRQAERLAELVERLLDVARVRTRRLTLEYDDVDLASLARAQVERVRAGLARPELLRLEADTPVVGRWDRARLDQVLANLVSNALKFGEGREVVVSVVGTPSGAVLSVADSGLGIAPEDQQRIFEQFERASAARNYGGLGLGLWLTRAIVVQHGGQITVESAPGQGSKFRVELPRGAKPQALAGAA